MFFLIPLLGFAVFAFLANRFFRQRKHARLATEWNCQPPVVRPHSWPLGFDLVQGMLKADKAHTVMNHLLEVWKQMGRANTWTQNLGGTVVVVTMEPEK